MLGLEADVHLRVDFEAAFGCSPGLSCTDGPDRRDVGSVCALRRRLASFAGLHAASARPWERIKSLSQTQALENTRVVTQSPNGL